MVRVNATGKESQSNFSPDNGTGQQVRTALKDILEALRTFNSDTGDPSGAANLAAYQMHINEVSNTSQILKIRNKANNGFVEIGDVAQTNLGLLLRAGGVMTGVLGTSTGSASAPSFHFGDTGTGLYKKGTNQIGLVANQSEISFLDQNGLTVNNQKEIRWKDSNNTEYIGLKAPSNITNNFTLTLPDEDGTSGQSLITNGSGTLSFGTPTISTATNFDVTSNITAAKAKVNSIIPKNGLPSGASGGIIQTKQTFKTDHFSVTSASYVDITGMTITITPQSSSSKILLEVVMNAAGQNNHYGAVRVMRTIGSGTAQHIGVSTAVSTTNTTQNQVNASFGIGVTSGGNSDIKLKTYGFKILDEPTTTDDVTYKLQVYAVNGSDAAVQFDLNRPSDVRINTNLKHFVGATSSMTAYEVTT